MKLVRYGANGNEKPGIVDQNGAIRELSGHVDDIAEVISLVTPLSSHLLLHLKKALLPATSVV